MAELPNKRGESFEIYFTSPKKKRAPIPRPRERFAKPTTIDSLIRKQQLADERRKVTNFDIENYYYNFTSVL